MDGKSLDIEGLNLENTDLNCFYHRKNDDNVALQENMLLTTGKDVEQKHEALRRAIVLKQCVLATELKLGSLKRYELTNRSPNELYYETQVNELNINVNNNVDALEKGNEKISLSLLNDDLTISFIDKRRSVAIGEKFNYQSYPLCNMEDTGKSKKNPLRAIGHFLDSKLRGHKRVKSDEFKVSDYSQTIRPRTLTNPFQYNKVENGSLNKNAERLGGERISLRSEIDPTALAEIEAFEKFIKDCFDRQNYYSF